VHEQHTTSLDAKQAKVLHDLEDGNLTNTHEKTIERLQFSKDCPRRVG
jgi:hypothetical protein